MIFEVYKGTNEQAESTLSDAESILKSYLEERLYIFPINRLRVRSNYCDNPAEVSIDVELDTSIGSELIYNRIIAKFFKHLHIDLVTLENKGDTSNFGYFFFGETVLLGYRCSFFVDVPRENYIPVNTCSTDSEW